MEELPALIATLTPDGQSLLRSVRARAQAAGLRERYEPGRAGRGEVVLLYGTIAETAVEVARLELKAGTLPRIWYAAGAAAAVEVAAASAAGGAAVATAGTAGPAAVVEAKEIAGLRDAAAAGDKLKALADARRAAEPQLDLFGRR